MMFVALALVLAGCGSGEGDPPFLALTADFADFQSWERLPVEDADAAHGAGPRVVYRSERPHRGAYAQGAMLVKTEGALEDPAAWLIFAMAKRGAGYNAEGTPGWEWFELTMLDGATPAIEWRGPDSPDGSTYGAPSEETGEPGPTCNDCHSEGHDGILSAEARP